MNNDEFFKAQTLKKRKVLDYKIKDIEAHLNREIYESNIKWDKPSNTSRKLKKNIMYSAWSIFKDYANPYSIFNEDNIENFSATGYRGIDEAIRFCIEIKIDRKHVDIIVSNLNINLKKTKNKIGKSFIYEITEKSFDLNNLRMECRVYTGFGRRDIYNFKWDVNLTIRENLNNI